MARRGNRIARVDCTDETEVVQRREPFDRFSPPHDDELAHARRWERLAGIRTPAQKRKNHYVPVSVLNGWTDDSGTLTAVARDGRYWPTTPAAIARQTNLYRAGVEIDGFDLGPEEAFSAIEGAAAAAMSRLLAQGEIDDGARYDLSLLVALQYFRAQTAIRELLPADLGGEVAELVRVLSALPPDKNVEAGDRVLKATDAVQELTAGQSDFVGFNRAFRFREVIDMVHQLAAMVYRREWGVARFEQPIVLLDDDPVAYVPLGLEVVRLGGQPTPCPSFVPLDAETLLCIENVPRSDVGTSFGLSALDCLRVSNRMQTHAVGHHLFSHPQAAELALITMRRFGTNTSR